jgi:hypothetical protein
MRAIQRHKGKKTPAALTTSGPNNAFETPVAFTWAKPTTVLPSFERRARGPPKPITPVLELFLIASTKTQATVSSMLRGAIRHLEYVAVVVTSGRSPTMICSSLALAVCIMTFWAALTSITLPSGGKTNSRSKTFDGDGVGFFVGDGVGFSVGDGVGFFVGDGVGFFVGDGVGFFVGDGVGFFVGDGVGALVGVPGVGVGSFVDNGVGTPVGKEVGRRVGASVGLIKGLSKGSMKFPSAEEVAILAVKPARAILVKK